MLLLSDDLDVDAGAVEDAEAPESRLRDRIVHVAQLAAVLAVTLVAWEVYVNVRDVKAFVLPPPSSIWDSLVAQLGTSEFWHDVVVTSKEAVIGFALGVGTAVILGVFVAEFRLVEKLVLPYVVALQTVPKVAIAPLLLIWFGFGTTSKVLMAAIVCFFPMLKNTIAGLTGTDPQLVEMMRSLCASRTQILMRCKMKSAYPILFAGMEISIVFAVLGAIVSEFTGATAGLGYRLLSYNYTFNVAGMFAIMATLAAIGLVAHAVLAVIRRRVVFWDRRELDITP